MYGRRKWIWASLAALAALATSLTFTFDAVAAPPPGLPEIEDVAVKNVLAHSAEPTAKIYSGQFDTAYYVEYGVTEAYGNMVPATPLDIGSGTGVVNIQQVLDGLAPDTNYHYRIVATNSHGTVSSKDKIFTTFMQSESFELPDERSYELVSPTEKNGGDIGGPAGVAAQAAIGGEAVTYESFTSFPGSQSAKINQYLSTRQSDGWSTQRISPQANLNLSYEVGAPYQSFSNDLSSAVLVWPFATLTQQAPIGYANLYVRDSTGGYKLVTTSAPANGSASHFVGASSDYSHIVFETEDALTPNAVVNSWNVYEWSGGELSLVSIPPGATGGAPASRAGDPGQNTQNAVSSNGLLVFWTDGNGQLYVRVNGTETVKVNASQRAPSLGDGSATFDGSISSGERVFFSDSTPLTNGPRDGGGLYEFNTSSGQLTDLTPSEAGGPGLLGIVGFSDDGSYVYFVASESLQAGAIAAQPNLYVEHDKQISFIATLSSEDGGDWARRPTERHAGVTPDGMHAVLMSAASLTGYDNGDATSGKPDSEVFLYDVGTLRLDCISCNPTGEMPVGPSSIPTWRNSKYNSYYLATDGNRVFFDSVDKLTVRDTNGMEDVYEWERNGVNGCARESGCVYLISSGVSESNSTFLAAGANGHDAFFATRARLVPQDADENIDVYDARVGGGFPVLLSTSAQCVGEACLGALATAPTVPSPLTASPQVAEGPGEGAPRSAATFRLGSIGRQTLRSLGRTGRMMLGVSVSEAGEVWARITTKIARRTEVIASDSARPVRAGTVGLKLTLTKLARSRLAAGHKLAVTITVGYSKVPTSRRVKALLSRSGSAR